MSKELKKKGILDGEVENQFQDHPEYVKVKDLALAQTGDETFIVKNPITGKTVEVTLSRDGTTDQKLAAILLSPDATSEQKEMMLANKLFEMGKDSASFLAELFRSKGQLTKETRAFKSQVRFDFESFVNSFTTYLDRKAESVISAYGWTVSGLYNDVVKRVLEDKTKKEERAKERALEGKEYVMEPIISIYEVIKQILKEKNLYTGRDRVVLLESALRDKDEADSIRSVVKNITLERERERGYGIYINNEGKSYSIFDSDIEDAVQKDKESTKHTTI